jgi:AP2 domain
MRALSTDVRRQLINADKVFGTHNLINCVNGDPSDIRWANLRQITPAQRQASKPVKNKLGVKGVWKTGHGKYAAEIRVDRKKRYLGQFETLEEASAMYEKTARKACGSFARAR